MEFIAAPRRMRPAPCTVQRISLLPWPAIRRRWYRWCPEINWWRKAAPPSSTAPIKRLTLSSGISKIRVLWRVITGWLDLRHFQDGGATKFNQLSELRFMRMEPWKLRTCETQTVVCIIASASKVNQLKCLKVTPPNYTLHVSLQHI